ncbi:MAG: hypothetical protein EZS28_026469, partial [Streblomastix strix]
YGKLYGEPVRNEIQLHFLDKTIWDYQLPTFDCEAHEDEAGMDDDEQKAQYSLPVLVLILDFEIGTRFKQKAHLKYDLLVHVDTGYCLADVQVEDDEEPLTFTLSTCAIVLIVPRLGCFAVRDMRRIVTVDAIKDVTKKYRDAKKRKDKKRKNKEDKLNDYDEYDRLKLQGRELDESEYVIGVVRVKILDLNKLAQNEPKRKPNRFVRLIIGGEEKETRTVNKALNVDYDELFDIDFDPLLTNERELFVEVWDRKKKKYNNEDEDEDDDDEQDDSDKSDYDYEDEVFIVGVALPFGCYFLNLQKLHLNLIGDQDEGQNEAAGDMYIELVYLPQQDYNKMIEKQKQKEQQDKEKDKEKEKPNQRNKKQRPKSRVQDEDDEEVDKKDEQKSMKPNKRGRYPQDDEDEDNEEDDDQKNKQGSRRQKPKQKDYASDDEDEDEDKKDKKDKQKEKERKPNQKPDYEKPKKEKEKQKEKPNDYNENKDFEKQLKNKPPQPPQGQRTIKALREAAGLKIPSAEAIAAHIKERERREQETERRHKDEEAYFVRGYVYIYLEELSDLIPFDVGNKSDPYVVLNLAGQEFRTEIGHKRLHAVYNRQYKFNFDPKLTKDREVKFAVWDQDRILWDEAVGEVLVKFMPNLEKPEELIREIEEDGADELLHLGDVLFGILYTTSEEDIDLPGLLDKKKQQEKENKKKQKQKKKQDKLRPNEDDDEGEEQFRDLDSVDSYEDKDDTPYRPYDYDQDQDEYEYDQDQSEVPDTEEVERLKDKYKKKKDDEAKRKAKEREERRLKEEEDKKKEDDWLKQQEDKRNDMLQKLEDDRKKKERDKKKKDDEEKKMKE